MNKLKLFIENFLVYGLGGIISKAVPLIMIPVVTRLMPDTTYMGISDLSDTVVSFASALAIMGMYDAMYRMFFEKEDEEFKKTICSTTLIFTLATSVIVFIIMLVFKDMIASLFFGNKEYAYVIYITATATLVGATNSIISAPTRMENKRKIFLITNTISPILSYSISIPLLLKGHYLIALPIAMVISNASMELIFAILNRKWFSIKRFDRTLLKDLLKIAIPLLPNFLIYWIFNSSDRVMITQILGVSEAGIYSIGSKLGHASQLIYTAFAGGWQYFAFSTMKEDDQVQSNSMVFEYLGVISFIAGMFMCAWSFLIFKLLFVGDYVAGYVVAPYLFLAPLLQMLFQVAANQFLVVKKTWPNLMILSVGAILNVIINLKLIPVLGIEGAAIATLVGYAVSDIICVIVLCKMKLMVVSGRFLFVSGVTLLYIIVWRLFFRENILVSTLLVILVSVLFLYLYRKELMGILCNLKKS